MHARLPTLLFGALLAASLAQAVSPPPKSQPAKAQPAKAQPAPAAPAPAPAASSSSESLPATMNLTGVPTPQEIYAQQKACEARKPPRKAGGTINESTYKRMERIIDSIGKGQYTEAEQKLDELSQSARGDYEKAIILQTLGFVYASESKQAKAIEAFDKAIATNALPQQAHEQMMFNVAQLYIADNKYDQGMKRLQTYLAESCNPVPDAHILLASVHAEKKQWNEALTQVNLALVKSKAPKENWLQLKLALHYELKQIPQCAEVLVVLVSMVPTKKDYWKQLSGILFEVKKDPDALAVLGLAERKGFLTEETEFKNLSNMYMFMQIPFKAANILEKGMQAKIVKGDEKNYESLANAWLMSREYDKAEDAMKKAAAQSDKGELFQRLGQIQIEQENWKGALESLQKAQSKGGLKDPGMTAFLIGVVASELKQWKTAAAALHEAQQHDKTTKQATEWLAHIEEEQAYIAQVEAAKEAAKQQAADKQAEKSGMKPPEHGPEQAPDQKPEPAAPEKK